VSAAVALNPRKLELSDQELTLLLEVCRTADLLDALQAQIDADGHRVAEGPRRLPTRAAPRICALMAVWLCLSTLPLCAGWRM
jgi:hypothetical protein